MTEETRGNDSNEARERYFKVAHPKSTRALRIHSPTCMRG